MTLGRPVARAPSAAARWAALGCWARAQARSNREREALEAWDPAAPERLDTEAWRQQTIAADPDGSLRQARRLAAHASALARTSGEQYAAASLQVQLAYEAGDRAGAERAARRLLILAPRSISTRQALRRWAGQ